MSMNNKKTIEDVDVTGKRVLARCDFNVPLENGVITDDKRIVEALPTIKYLSSHGAKVILCSHFGRPKGQFNPEFSLAPVAKRLSELLGREGSARSRRDRRQRQIDGRLTEGRRHNAARERPLS